MSRSALNADSQAGLAPLGFCLRELAGRLSELTVEGAAGAAVTVAFRLVLEAQAQGEPVAWVTPAESSFFPPDAAEGGVDVGALVVVRPPDAGGVARAADPLLRSGAFGLVVLDVGRVRPPMPLMSRLLGLAQKHDAVVLFLTEGQAVSLGSLISLRAQASWRRSDEGEFVCEVRVVKDKRRAPDWTFEEVCRGPAGLR